MSFLRFLGGALLFCVFLGTIVFMGESGGWWWLLSPVLYLEYRAWDWVVLGDLR